MIPAGPVHALTLAMGNLCGEPTSSPAGGAASNVSRNVTCPACLLQLGRP